MAFLSSLRQIASHEASSISHAFMPDFFKLVLGTLSLPINLPNTNYHRGLQVHYLSKCSKFTNSNTSIFWVKFLSFPVFWINNSLISSQARKQITGLLRKLVEVRKDSRENQQDMLGYLLSKQNNYKLNDDELVDLIITILYSGYETVSTTSMMAVKYLHDHPKVLEELRVSGNFNY